jgi:hypothetical protein
MSVHRTSKKLYVHIPCNFLHSQSAPYFVTLPNLIPIASPYRKAAVFLRYFVPHLESDEKRDSLYTVVTPVHVVTHKQI